MKADQLDQWKSIARPEIKLCMYDHLPQSNQECTTESIIFNKWCWLHWATTCKEMKLDDSLNTIKKVNSKRIKGCHIRPETIKLRRNRQ